MKILKSHKSFNGTVQFHEHQSFATKTIMRFSTFLPSTKISGALIWLSGLTCTEENFIAKAGAQKHLADNGLMLICPDTSPRGLNLPGEHDSYDFGSGAGFYVNAKTEAYKNHYHMFSYISDEIHFLLQSDFAIAPDKISISGHSMGGHGALVIGLREPSKFRTVSAFAPITHPSLAPWGKKAFTGYLGTDHNLWAQYDACELVKAGHTHPREILIDQGTADEYLETQLMPLEFQNACAGKQKLQLRMQKDYDHSYYFISTFIKDHIDFINLR